MPAVQSEQFKPSSSAGADARIARDAMLAVDRAAAALHEIVRTMTDATLHAPSRLPGWTRGHVVSHLARSADGLVNLLTWARTGVEHPMYASAADRAADIEEGAHRLARVQQEDVLAAHQRFCQAVAALADADWAAHVVDRRGNPMAASLVPWARLTELLVHQVDLDMGVDFERVADLVGPQSGPFVDYVVARYDNRTDVPAVRLTVTLPDGAERTWTIGGPEEAVDVRGTVATATAWLTGRDEGEGLSGDVPTLPAWL